MPTESKNPYVSRGGLKLHHALQTFRFDPTNLDCVDLGCATGGFTDGRRQDGARSVACGDTADGPRAYTLRTDER
ncbi:MAG: SAM-dependent methyltransferase, partial [Planctomycetota bacterium]